MSPIVRAAKLMLNGLIFITLIACAIWCAAFIYFFLAYELLESLAFALGSIHLLVLICGMICHDRPSANKTRQEELH